MVWFTLICIFTAAAAVLIPILAGRRRRRLSKPEHGSTVTNLPPGSFGWPFLGETLEFLRANYHGSPGKFVTDRIQNYKSRVFKTSFLGERVAVLWGPAGNRFLFSNETKSVRVWWPASVRKLLGRCLATSSGEEAVQSRKQLSYFLGPDAFSRLYIRTVDIVSRHHLDTHWRGKEEIIVFPSIKLHAFDLACRLFMSIDDPSRINKLYDLFNVFLPGIISIPIYLPGTKFYNASWAIDGIRKELGIILRQRRKALGRDAASLSNDLLSHLLRAPDEDGRVMPDEVIVNNILLMIWAGHDTTASTVTLVMKALSENPHVYEMVLREQNEIASSKEAPGDYLQWEDIQKMRYSWSVVCETLRLWPPVMGAYREALEDVSYGGYHIPKGWKFYWNAQSVHADPSLFPDETRFDPSRFEGAGPAPYSFVPFGGGPRMCLGKEFARLEILAFLHYLVRRFEWEMVVPGEKIRGAPFLTPEKGLPIRIRPRA